MAEFGILSVEALQICFVTGNRHSNELESQVLLRDNSKVEKGMAKRSFIGDNLMPRVLLLQRFELFPPLQAFPIHQFHL
jgi:hypothetical protein